MDYVRICWEMWNRSGRVKEEGEAEGQGYKDQRQSLTGGFDG